MELCKTGIEIQQLQDDAGMNDQLLSGRLEITVGTLDRWKQGKNEIHPVFMRELRKICQDAIDNKKGIEA